MSYSLTGDNPKMTECPRCGNNFTESKAQKTEDGDTVRCPNCNRRQDGLGHLEDRFAI